MQPQHIMPSLMIVLSLAAAAFYVPLGDHPRVVYYVAAAVITASVTFKF